MSAAEKPPEPENALGADGASEADALEDGPADERAFIIYAESSVINTGNMSGSQHLHNQGGASGGPGRRPAESREGPISAEELDAARAGFAEPDWFDKALTRLDSRLLFLAGEPGSGRRTAALHLLLRHSGSSALRAVESGDELAQWRPARDGTRGYLVAGASLHQPLRRWAVDRLRQRLRAVDARMVIVLAASPGVLRDFRQEHDLSPQMCIPPPPRTVFDARLRHAVPDAAERTRLLGALDTGLLDELLAPDLTPAQVAELVSEISAGNTDAAALRERLSFLAREEVPHLLAGLRDKPDSLAFLLATAVFQGLDQRIVREQAELLLERAEGQLDSVLHESDGSGTSGSSTPRPNPRFAFRQSLEDLLRDVSARVLPQEIHRSSDYSYTVEPVRFVRHGRREAVLRHLWREYGQTAALMTRWLKDVKSDPELAQAVGRFMGMAASWGGGRQALRHIRALADSPRATTRAIAAYALGMAAEDPVLVWEVRHRLSQWSTASDWKLRGTVAYACGTDYGISRPDQALRLLGRLTSPLDREAEGEASVRWAVKDALMALSAAGNQTRVLETLATWADDKRRAGLALPAFGDFLRYQTPWVVAQLLRTSEAHDATGTADVPERILTLTRQTLNDDELFETIARTVLVWCRIGGNGDERTRAAVELLLSALAGHTRHGEFRLFVRINEDEDTGLAGRSIARRALNFWRNGTRGGTA
ncbi:hypothetical protein ACTWP5_25595 [Streptomyces sp. 4N509B]|uniref:hypothetical protein n=1 Tax=Streptomyces sp. 4N509B TaxID=3457413 RepID=UPI003FD0747F